LPIVGKSVGKRGAIFDEMFPAAHTSLKANTAVCVTVELLYYCRLFHQSEHLLVVAGCSVSDIAHALRITQNRIYYI